MEQNEAGQSTNAPVNAPSRNWGGRLIGYIKRKRHERKAKKEKETSVERAARLTSQATIWIAVFTVAMAIFAGGTLYEVIDGSSDTHKLAQAAKDQSQAALVLAAQEMPGTPKIQVDWVGAYRGFDRPFADVRLRNAGGGVALDARVAVEIQFGGEPPNPKSYPFRKDGYHDDIDKIILPSPTGTGVVPREYGRPLPEAEISSITYSNAPEYIFGVFEYHTLDNPKVLRTYFCRCASAKEVLSKKAFDNQKQIDEGVSGPEYVVGGDLRDCLAK